MLPKGVQNNLVEKLSLRENNKNIMIHKNYLGPIVCDICQRSLFAKDPSDTRYTDCSDMFAGWFVSETWAFHYDMFIDSLVWQTKDVDWFQGDTTKKGMDLLDEATD